MTPISKVSGPKFYKGFRPISLLHHLGKLCERVIINKLKSGLENFTEANQYAYRPNIGITAAIVQLIDYALRG